jgi:hypothetical protein
MAFFIEPSTSSKIKSKSSDILFVFTAAKLINDCKTFANTKALQKQGSHFYHQKN